MPKPKLAMVVNEVTKIPLRLQIDGVEHLAIHEDGAIRLMGKQVGSDPALAAALLNETPVKVIPPRPRAKQPAAREPAAKKPAAREPTSTVSSPVD